MCGCGEQAIALSLSLSLSLSLLYVWTIPQEYIQAWNRKELALLHENQALRCLEETQGAHTAGKRRGAKSDKLQHKITCLLLAVGRVAFCPALRTAVSAEVQSIFRSPDKLDGCWATSLPGPIPVLCLYPSATTAIKVKAIRQPAAAAHIRLFAPSSSCKSRNQETCSNS